MPEISLTELSIFVTVAIATIFWFWSLIDCAVRDHERDMDKLVWVAIIISTYVFGSLAYIFVWRGKTTRR